jgi:hypothetical protein
MHCRVATVLLLALPLVGAGCSKPSDSSSTPPDDRPAQPLGRWVRLIKPGDFFEYDVHSEVRFHKQRQTVKLTATRTESIIQTTLEGKEVLCECVAFLTTAENGHKTTNNWKTYLVQDAPTRRLTTLGDTRGKDGALRLIENPTSDTPGCWSAATTINAKHKYFNGDTTEWTNAVVGTEVVSTPAAKFTCWKLHCTQVSVENGKALTANGTMWYAPQIGIVKAEVVLEWNGEYTETFTMVLRSTNVAIEPQERHRRATI